MNGILWKFNFKRIYGKNSDRLRIEIFLDIAKGKQLISGMGNKTLGHKVMQHVQKWYQL